MEQTEKEIYLRSFERKSSYIDSEIADRFGLDSWEMNKILMKAGIQYRENACYYLHIKHRGKGYITYYCFGGDERTRHRRWLSKGLGLIYDVLTELGYKLNEEVVYSER